MEVLATESSAQAVCLGGRHASASLSPAAARISSEVVEDDPVGLDFEGQADRFRLTGVE
jgi:hypothetical protein